MIPHAIEFTSTAATAKVASSGHDPWQPRISAVPPIRNEAEHIEACLEHLLEQDYPRELLEHLVVDGGSGDGTREAVMRVRRTLAAWWWRRGRPRSARPSRWPRSIGWTPGTPSTGWVAP